MLMPELSSHGVYADARCVLTGVHRGKKSRGGLRNYEKLSNDILLWMKEDSGPDSWFTTMVDYYDLPVNFPGCEACRSKAKATERVECLESAFDADISSKLAPAFGLKRFVPHIQLYEFETLLFTDAHKFLLRFPSAKEESLALAEICVKAKGPENIDGGAATHPSRRINDAIRGYDKRSNGIELALAIGLPDIRAACPHFNAWVSRLERLAG